MEIDADNLVLIAAIAVLAPILADVSPGRRLPIVVAEVALGIILGPSLLGIVETDELTEALSSIGLAFLFFLAGLELDPARIRGRPLDLGGGGWAISLATGLAVAAGLAATGLIDSPILVGLALTTTALGTLMPILRDTGVVEQRLGAFIVGAGAAGEFLPLVALSVITAFVVGEPLHSALLIVFAIVAVVAGAVALRARPARLVRLLGATMHSSGQLAVRLAILILAALVALATGFGLDLVLGAFTAGIVVGIALQVEGEESLDAAEFRSKIEAVGFGFLVPVFFIATGIDFDLDALVSDPAALALVPGFAVLFLLTRGLPVALLYRRALPDGRDRASLALFSAAALPLLIAITTLGVDSGSMKESEALSLIGAGMLSVLVFPILGLAVRRRSGERA
ncbi:cation:proton antiporter [Thermoleophilia bacterium SCSIO 60948]|nr:cation:proton antiporter [Thermoleophilia bacterium SCSIO 60948]